MWILMIGFGMMGLTVAIHAFGSTLWLEYTELRLKKAQRYNKRIHPFYIISVTSVALLLLHVIEVLFWALVFLQLPGQTDLSKLHDAFYLSMITFTTVGYGDITLAGEWQSLAGMEAMAGIVVFGLTTAMLFAMIQKSWSYYFLETGEKK